MQHHTSYRGRSHTKSLNNYKKPKISLEERKMRLAKKKLAKIFSLWRTLHPDCKHSAAKKNSVPAGAEFRVKMNDNPTHIIPLIKMSSNKEEYRRTGP